VNPNLAMAAFIFGSVGNRRRTDETLTEALESMRDLRHLGLAVMEAPGLVWAALTLGREAEVVEVLEREAFKSPWLRASLAVAAQDFHGAAEICGAMQIRSLEAFFRLQSGAEPDVRAALDFYRRVRATRYLREGEALLAATA
jgi:hypothetical protein